MPPREPPHRLPDGIWHQRWAQFTAIHWPFPPEVVQALLPSPLSVDTFDDQAWVGITPLLMDDVRMVGMPALPGLSRFPELNVRTFVIGPDGLDGLWFFSLEAALLPFVLAARALYGAPYVWAGMRIEEPDESTRHYASRRRWPGSSGARATVAVEIGAEIPEGNITDLDVFVTTRWRAYARNALGWASVAVEHPPWPLHRATLRQIEENLLATAGLPAPAAPPVVHYSPGVDVRLGLPHRVQHRS